MDSIKAIKRLEEQIKIFNNTCLTDSPNNKSNCITWLRNTEIVITQIFGKNSKHENEFLEIKKRLPINTINRIDNRKYYEGLHQIIAMINSMMDELKEYGFINNNESEILNSYIIINTICQYFHRFARQLQDRYHNRPTIDINDEYDVQDLLHALLRIHFDDIRPEEYTPSYAGSSTRLDFLLKHEEVVIEVKKTRNNLKSKEIGEQLIIDIAHYKEHPNCKYLICFVYGPEGKVSNPTGLERDLEKLSTDDMKVKVIITPKN